MNKKNTTYLIVSIAIILILAGGYSRIYHGNSHGLMFVGGVILLILRYKE